MLQLSADQDKALTALLSWFKDKNRTQYITLGGYAGTGKTTLISILRKELDKEDKKLRVAFCSYTGKAARVLRTKLKEANTIYPKDSVGTIHSLIYSPLLNQKEEIVGWERRDKIDADLIIVDEASMVDQNIWMDLTSYKLPIIAVGDHGQLPPINGNFNLMEKPMYKLEEIHRQAKDNPIIKLSIYARERGFIPQGAFSAGVKKLKRSESGSDIEELLNSYNEDTLILCGYNNTRIKLNQHVRHANEIFTPDPIPGDRVICLRNNHKAQIFNGMLGTIYSIDPQDEDWYFAEIGMDEEEKVFKGLIAKNQFNSSSALNYTDKRSKTMRGDLFDFGYALTVHKSQGSQARKVVLFEERFKQMDDGMWRRWLYTAVTRAEEELYVIG